MPSESIDGLRSRCGLSSDGVSPRNYIWTTLFFCDTSPCGYSSSQRRTLLAPRTCGIVAQIIMIITPIYMKITHRIFVHACAGRSRTYKEISNTITVYIYIQWRRSFLGWININHIVPNMQSVWSANRKASRYTNPRTTLYALVCRFIECISPTTASTVCGAYCTFINMWLYKCSGIVQKG